jgi:hypothetical protein
MLQTTYKNGLVAPKAVRFTTSITKIEKRKVYVAGKLYVLDQNGQEIVYATCDALHIILNDKHLKERGQLPSNM